MVDIHYVPPVSQVNAISGTMGNITFHIILSRRPFANNRNQFQ